MGSVRLFVGFFFFSLSLFSAAVAAAVFGAAENDITGAGWGRTVKLFGLRLFTAVPIILLALMGYWMLTTSTIGFRTFVTPYVEWLKSSGALG